MADHSISFHIGSSFSGEGFKKAQQAVSSVNKDARAGVEVLSKLATSFGGLDGAAARAVGAVTGMLNSVLTLNPVVLGITAAISALSFGLKELKKREEAVKKAVEDHRKEMEKLLEKTNKGCFDAAISEARKLGTEYDRITKHANEMNAAINALVNQKAAGGVLQLQADKIVAVFNEVTDEGKQLVAAEYDLKIATAEAAAARERAFMEVESAEKAVADKENEIANLSEQRAAMEKHLIRMKENNAAVAVMEKSARERILQQINDLQAKMGEVDGKILSAKETLEVLHVKEQTAIEKRTAAETAAAMKVTDAEQKQIELVDAIEKRKKAEEERAEIEAETERQERDAIAQREEQRMREQEEREAVIEATKKAAEAQKLENEAKARLKKAEEDYANALAAYTSNINNILVSEAVMKGTLGKVGEAQKRQEDAAQRAVDAGIKDGTIRNSRQQHEIEKAAKRAQRDAESSADAKQEQRDKQRADRIEKMGKKARSKQDQDFLDAFNKRKEKREEELANKKKLEDMEKKRQEEKKQAEQKREDAKKMDRLNDAVKQNADSAKAEKPVVNNKITLECKDYSSVLGRIDTHLTNIESRLGGLGLS